MKPAHTSPEWSGGRPPVTLWIFNHSFRYISEQIEFFCSSLAQHGYPVRVSRHANPATLNVVIENFSPQTALPVARFCRDHRKRVAVVQTEHIDLVDGRVYFHGVEIGSRDDYIAPGTKIQRLTSLLTMREHVRSFFRLGDLPRLRNVERMLPGLTTSTIPFPLIRPSDRSLPGVGGRASEPFDLVFTGILTAHRQRVLKEISERFAVHVGREAVSRRRRDALNAASRLVLNVPQNEGWTWISTMRVLAALRCGRATVAIGDFEECAINRFCARIAPNAALLPALRQLLERGDALFEHHIAAYNEFAASDGNSPFPHEEFELWGALEL